MRVTSGRVSLVAAALFFFGVAAVWVFEVPVASGQTPIITKICSDGPLQKCKEVTTCEGNTCTTTFYYYL